MLLLHGHARRRGDLAMLLLLGLPGQYVVTVERHSEIKIDQDPGFDDLNLKKVYKKFNFNFFDQKLRIHADPDTDPDPKPWLQFNVKEGNKFRVQIISIYLRFT
jgi:hypothetical protein